MIPQTPQTAYPALFAPETGSVTVKVLPLPTSLSTPISPPHASTTSFTRANPSPAPPYRRCELPFTT